MAKSRYLFHVARLVMILSFFLFLINNAAAAEQPFKGFGEGITSAIDIFWSAVGAFLDNKVYREHPLIIFRFAFTLATFIIAFAALSKVPAFNRRQAAGLAIGIALIMLVVDPKTIMALGSIYVVIMLSIFMLAPVVGVFYAVSNLNTATMTWPQWVLGFILIFASIAIVIFFGDISTHIIGEFGELTTAIN